MNLESIFDEKTRKNLEKEMLAVQETILAERHRGVDIAEVASMMQLDIMSRYNLSSSQFELYYQIATWGCSYEQDGVVYCRNGALSGTRDNICPYQALAPDSRGRFKCMEDYSSE